MKRRTNEVTALDAARRSCLHSGQYWRGASEFCRKLVTVAVAAGPCTYEPCDDVAPTPDYENALTD